MSNAEFYLHAKTCPECGRKFSKPSEMIEHLIKEHIIDEYDKFLKYEEHSWREALKKVRGERK